MRPYKGVKIITTLEQLNLSQPLTDVYTAMETDLMIAIARQLAEDGRGAPAGITATSEWRLKKLAEAGALSKETVRIIASYTGIQSDLLTEAIEGAAMGVAERLEPALQACARDGYISSPKGTPISEGMKNVVTNFRKQAKTDLNLVNTVMQYKAKSSYTTLVNKIYDDTKRRELLGVLGKHTLEVASGGTSRQEALRNCIKEFSQKGIPAFVDKLGREWSPEAYINMDIRTTVNNTANAAQDACCDRYGLDLIAISSHMGARPKCALDQGKLYSRSNRSGIAHDGDGNEIPFYPWSSTSYGQPDGILGINCHHHKYPFADGVNFQRYFPYDQEENAARYKEFQKQRAMERRVREVSRQAEMLEAAGDVEGAKAARRQLREKRKAYREYSKEHGLGIHNDRLTVVKVKNGDTSYRNIYGSGLTDKGGSGIINIENKSPGADKFLHSTLKEKNSDTRKMAYGLRKSPKIKLSDNDKSLILNEITAINAAPDVFVFRDGFGSGYSDSRDIIFISSNIFPSNDGSLHPRDLMSERAVLAHEYYGHRTHRGTALEKGSWNDEFRASYTAAKICPNLTDEDRRYLILDAIERAKEAGINIRYNDFIRRVLYGKENG